MCDEVIVCNIGVVLFSDTMSTYALDMYAHRKTLHPSQR